MTYRVVALRTWECWICGKNLGQDSDSVGQHLWDIHNLRGFNFTNDLVKIEDPDKGVIK